MERNKGPHAIQESGNFKVIHQDSEQEKDPPKFVELGAYQLLPPKYDSIFHHTPISAYKFIDIIECVGCFQDKPKKYGGKSYSKNTDIYTHQKNMDPDNITIKSLTGSALHRFIPFIHNQEEVEAAGFDYLKLMHDRRYAAYVIEHEWPEFLNTIDPLTEKARAPQLAQHLVSLRNDDKFDDEITQPLLKYLENPASFDTRVILSESDFGFLLSTKGNFFKFDYPKRVKSKTHIKMEPQKGNYIPINGRLDEVRIGQRGLQLWEYKRDVRYTQRDHALQLGIENLGLQYLLVTSGMDQTLDLQKDMRYGGMYYPEMYLYGFKKGDIFKLNITDFGRFDELLRNTLFYSYFLMRSQYREYKEGHKHKKGSLSLENMPQLPEIQIGNHMVSHNEIYQKIDRLMEEFDSTYHFEALSEESDLSDLEWDEEVELFSPQLSLFTSEEEKPFIPRPNRITIPKKEGAIADLRDPLPLASERDFVWIPLFDEEKPFSDAKMIQKRILKRKGIVTEKEQFDFLHPDITPITAESVGIEKKEIDKAKSLIQEKIEKEEKIVVYGDSDVDGICSAILTVEALSSLGADVYPFIPSRKIGYGLNPKGIDMLPHDTSLIITTDNGVAAHEGVMYAGEQQIPTILIDHHDLPPTPVFADATIHTQKVAATGAAYLFTKELLGEISPAAEQRRVELTALATIADRMPLVDENRAFAKIGIEYMQNSRIKGLNALMNLTKVESGSQREDEFDLYRFHENNEVSYRIIPKLNSPGRIGDPMDTYRLLTTTDQFEAQNLAKKLMKTNERRQKMVSQAVADIKRIIEKDGGQKDRMVFAIGEESDQWPTSINPEVARKVRAEFGLPTIILTKNGDGYTGAAESIKGFYLKDELKEAEKFLSLPETSLRTGGLTLRKENIQSLYEYLTSIANRKVTDDMLKYKITYDLELSLLQTDVETYDAIAELGPFGNGNDEPVLITTGADMDIKRYIGDYEQSAHITLRNDGSRPVPADAYFMASRVKVLDESPNGVDVLFTQKLDSKIKGKTKLVVKAIRPSNKRRKPDKKKEAHYPMEMVHTQEEIDVVKRRLEKNKL